MSTIVETLNIGFVIPLIEMEGELSLTLSQKGILNSASFIGQLTSIINCQFRATLCSDSNQSFDRCRYQFIFMGFSR